MIRANLLPPRKDKLRFFGVGIEREIAATLAFAATTVAGTAAGTFGLEALVCGRLQRDVDAATATVAAHAPFRAQAQALALDVARYQEFARELAIVSPSGLERADDVVRVGNVLPQRVWLDSLVSAGDHTELSGTSVSLEMMGTALTALDGALPGSNATLVRLERPKSDARALRFVARLDAP
jgi:hypothetical protein